jgi:hypothetical protein
MSLWAIWRKARRWLRSSLVPLPEDVTQALDAVELAQHLDRHAELQRQLGALAISRKAIR